MGGEGWGMRMKTETKGRHVRRAQPRVPAMASLAENKEAGLGGSVPSVCPGVQDACLWSPASLFSINPAAWLSQGTPVQL